ncbi:tRNA G18 (ribose-2'-O)-methylase SpoU [Arthrobacter sp. B3I9]|nr:tRNA G18 (ribose-2'-O)-methylase SpoU [Arthrobacter sp. B3I9]
MSDYALENPTAWLFGNEAQGLSEEELALADHRVAVPVYGSAESLNLGTAATVCLYASARSQGDRATASQVDRATAG